MVSVIIPCYNQEKYIAEALESVWNQTYNNWECLVVNDGSTDSSVNIINKYTRKDKRFKLINQENKGVAAARNHGFQKASGSYIQFLDADDLLLPDKLEKHVDFLINHPDVDIVYCVYQHLYQKNGQIEQYTFTDISIDPLENFLFHWDRGVSIPPHAPLYRKNLWEEHDLPYPTDYNDRYEDWVFWVVTALKKPIFSQTVKPLVLYRIHDNNFCSDADKVAMNMLTAASFIKNIIPQSIQNQFWNATTEYVLQKYYTDIQLQDELNNYIIRLNRKKFNFLKPLSKLLRIFK